MRVLLLYALLLFAIGINGDDVAEKVCTIKDYDKYVSPVNIDQYSNCTVLESSDKLSLTIESDVNTPDIFERIFGSLITIRNLGITIYGNDLFTSIAFPKLENITCKEDCYFNILRFPKLETIYFESLNVVDKSVQLITYEVDHLSQGTVKKMEALFSTTVLSDVCYFEDKAIVVNESFMEQCRGKKLWRASKNTEIILGSVNEDTANTLFHALTNITNVKLSIRNSTAQGIEFSELSSWTYDGTIALEVRNCPNLSEISFPKLEDNQNISIEIIAVNLLKPVFLAKLRAQFPNSSFEHYSECDKGVISDVSVLSNCTALSSLSVAPGTSGLVNTSISFIRDELKIVDTKLDHLSFLNLSEKYGSTTSECAITDNQFCSYNETAISTMIGKRYKNCTIERNTKVDCVCQLGAGRVTANQAFIEKCGKKNIWIGSKRTELIVPKGLKWKVIQQIIGKVENISNVRVVIRNCIVRELIFWRVTEWTYQGGVALEVRDCPKLELLHIPKLVKDANISIRVYYSPKLQRAVEYHFGTYPKISFKECNVLNQDNVAKTPVPGLGLVIVFAFFSLYCLF